MGFFSFLSGVKTADNLAAAIPKVVSATIKGIDALVFTDEEKSNFVKGLLGQMYDNFMPRAISRRVLATIILGVFAIYALVALGMAIADRTAIVNNIINLAESIKLGWMAMTVVAFYFGIWPFVTKKKDE